MKFTFVEKKMDVSDEIRTYAERKIGKMERFFRSETEASVTFGTERGRYRAEITLANDGMFYRASELTSDMYTSIDAGCASIERQIRKHKTKLEKKLYTGTIQWDVPTDETEDTEQEDSEYFDVVRTKRFPLKPMTVEEAILQMNLLEHTFFAFRNQDENEAFSVVYTRKHGGYGLITEN